MKPKYVFFIFAMILFLNLTSANCTYVYAKQKSINPDVIFLFQKSNINLTNKKLINQASLFNRYLNFNPFNKYKYAYYMEDNKEDCLKKFPLAVPVIITFENTNKYCGLAGGEMTKNHYYKTIKISLSCNDRHTFLHEIGHTLGNLNDLSIYPDSRESGRKTLMHYGQYSYYLELWQKEDIIKHIKFEKKYYLFRYKFNETPSWEDLE